MSVQMNRNYYEYNVSYSSPFSPVAKETHGELEARDPLIFVRGGPAQSDQWIRYRRYVQYEVGPASWFRGFGFWSGAKSSHRLIRSARVQYVTTGPRARPHHTSIDGYFTSFSAQDRGIATRAGVAVRTAILREFLNGTSPRPSAPRPVVAVRKAEVAGSSLPT
jgi:hypothetical protein